MDLYGDVDLLFKTSYIINIVIMYSLNIKIFKIKS